MNEFKRPKGINFSCSEEINSDELSSNLLLIVNFLQQTESFNKLNRYDDWWEHDGLHFYRDKIDFGELQKIVSLNGLKQEFKLGDFDVFIGIAPIDNVWYLRFYLDVEEDLGRFDITLSDEMAELFGKEIQNKLSIEMKKQPSETYYNSIIC